MADEVLIEIDDGIAVITINRPQARNAVNGAVSAGIAAAVEDLDARRDVRVLDPDRRGRHLQRGHGPEGLPDRG